MRKILFIAAAILLLPLLGFWLFFQPIDIRNQYLKEGPSPEKHAEGLELLHLMEQAYGGKEKWDSLERIHFIQVADWYGKQQLSHWDTTPQRFRMEVVPGSMEGEMTLLNGPRGGKAFRISQGEYFVKSTGATWQVHPEDAYFTKMQYKNYWFQFPFRIGEAEILAYAGWEEINGVGYELLFASWKTEAANREFDQFLMYLNEESYLIEYLYFTVRDKFPSVAFTSKFDGFTQVGPFTLPTHQYVSKGKPGQAKIKLHENHSEDIILKWEKFE